MTKSRIAIFGIVVLVGLVSVVLVLFAQGTLVLPINEDNETAAEFATAVLTRKNLQTFKDLDGILEYGDSFQISPTGSGVLTHIAPEGSQLDRGAVIFRLYRSIDDTDIIIADQQIASASASVASAQLALQNLNAPATTAQIASANASVASAQLALQNLNEPATPAQIASANAAVAQAQLALDNLNEPATPAQIASANAAVAQTQLALDNLNEPATPAQIASANAAVAQAQLAVDNLNATATSAQIASADAAIAQAQLAQNNLKAPDISDQLASANGAVAQAEANLATAQVGVDTAWASLRIAHQAFCDAAENAEPPVFSYLPPVCPVDIVLVTEPEKNTLLDMIGGDYLVAPANSLLNAYQGRQSALGSRISAENNLVSARSNLDALNEPSTDADLAQASAALIQAQENRDALDDPPTATQIAQVSESLLNAQENRATLDEPPGADALAQASESLKSAQENRAALDEPPGPDALAQASESLKSAQENRAELDEPPEPDALAQADATLESAQASLEIALANRDELIEGPSAGVLMFGDVPAWREFQIGITPGEDVMQLEQNLFVLGYGAPESLDVDQIFDADTADAITKMQVDLGIIATGRIEFGDVIFLPGTSVVEASTSFPSLGSTVNPGSALVSLISIERIETRIAQIGTISLTTESLQRVETTIEVADQHLIDIGSEVRIELPDESIVVGVVMEIGSIAVVPQGGQNDPYLEVSIAIQGDADLYEWTGAPVTASVTKTLAENALAAPVTSLLALLGGGYALEVIEPSSTRLVAVEAGVYADGWVEVDGIGLDAGMEVVTPQ